MGSEAIITIVVIVLMLLALYLDLIRPSVVFLIAVLIFYLTGILTIEECLHGLSNENVILIFALIVTSDIIKKTTVLDSWISNVFSRHLTYKGFMWRMTGIVTFISAWINNTPLVAFMIPYVNDWAKKKKISPSKVLLPVSYAAILGGTLTLIGTSTNLVVNGLAMEAGQESLNMFDFAWVGIPVAILGCLYLVLIGSKILPYRKDILSSFNEKNREYLVETMVPPKSKFIGKTIKKTRLRTQKGLYLIQLIRGNKIISPVSSREIIMENDRLFFAGNTNNVIELVEGSKNLALPYGQTMLAQTENNIIELMITNNSVLHNNTAKGIDFRSKYDAVIIAIQRKGEKLSGKIGEIILKAGDLLLAVAGKDFNKKTVNESDFYELTRIKEIIHIPSWKKRVFFTSLIIAFVLSVLNILPLLIGLLIVAGITAFTRMIKFTALKGVIDLDLFFMLVLALAVGKAIDNSGVARLGADFLMNILKGNPVGVLAGLYLITNITTMMVTNAAAAAITFPIAFAAAQSIPGVNVKAYILTIAIAASSEFLTPFGYQTNQMVYGPGGYKFRDYLKVGFPLTILVMILTILILSFVYKLF